MDISRALSRIGALARLPRLAVSFPVRPEPVEGPSVRGSTGSPRTGGPRRAAFDGPAGLYGSAWAPLSYGDYYPRSVLVYSAIRVRQDAVARVPLRVHWDGRGRRRGAAEAVQRLLDSPNPLWTAADLWRATETYLGLWGSAYWGLERDPQGRASEIWPLRPDRVRVVPGPERSVRGFLFTGQGLEPVPYLPEDVLWLRYFNPLEEHAGLSPVAPVRLSADMGLDALRANRSGLANESTPGLFIETEETPTDDEVRDFYERWESRFRGVERARRPVLLSQGMKPSNLGFSPRDMEYLHTLRWALEDVARAFGVPKAMLGDIERITFSNVRTARRIFWEDTIVPQLAFYRDALQHRLLPNLGVDVSGLSVDFDLTAVEALQESEQERAGRLQGYVKAGIMTVNEVRQELKLPPVSWGEGPSA